MQETTENAMKNALKVLKVHFEHQKSLLRTKIDLRELWSPPQNRTTASGNTSDDHIFSLTYSLGQSGGRSGRSKFPFWKAQTHDSTLQGACLFASAFLFVVSKCARFKDCKML